MLISYDVDVDEDDDDLGQRQKCFPVNLLFPKPVGNHPEKYFLNSIAQNWLTGFEKRNIDKKKLLVINIRDLADELPHLLEAP